MKQGRGFCSQTKREFRFFERLCAASLLVLMWGFAQSSAAEDRAAKDKDYVGSAVCAGCHESEAKAWAASQHAHAMQPATEATVLGDFNNATASHFSSKARFYRKDGRFFVSTEGKDGKEAEFAVAYTFGVEPLQQYLTEFPDGRVQVLPYAWDARPKTQGGQRWFHMYPDEDIPLTDVLHWTGPQQNWNYMCAECHSTGVHKNYDAAKDRFKTTFSEVSIGCEACHGAGVGHVEWAKNGRPATAPHGGFASVAAARGAVSWFPDAKTGSPSEQTAPVAGGVNETCDRCHSRRGQFSEDWRPGRPLTATHLPALLTSDLFEDDGQMKDEVFNTSSFQQSKMYAKGVVCTDCHDAHSGKLKAAKSEVCSQCHDPQKFASTSHTGHAQSAASPDCVACHMPARTYMVVDVRHDHSFRIPRPDISARIGTPNACAPCHADHDAAWAASAVERWHGPERKGFQTYAEAFHAARLDLPEARELLLKVARDPAAPAIARATALFDLGERPSAAVLAEIERGLKDPDPMVRIGALRAMERLPLDLRWDKAKGALADPDRAVRMEAASLLADAPVSAMSEAERSAWDAASQEYIAAKRFNADRAEERANLARFYVKQGKADLAERELRAAIALSPRQIPPRVDLADLYRGAGREAEAEKLLRETVAENPQAAAAHHALGLSLIRQKRYADALASLKRAAELEPSAARYAYVYGVALQSLGQMDEGRQTLAAALRANPSNVEILTALLQDALKSGDAKGALGYAERLRVLNPDDPSLAKFIERLRAAQQQ